MTARTASNAAIANGTSSGLSFFWLRGTAVTQSRSRIQSSPLHWRLNRGGIGHPLLKPTTSPPSFLFCRPSVRDPPSLSPPPYEHYPLQHRGGASVARDASPATNPTTVAPHAEWRPRCRRAPAPPAVVCPELPGSSFTQRCCTVERGADGDSRRPLPRLFPYRSSPPRRLNVAVAVGDQPLQPAPVFKTFPVRQIRFKHSAVGLTYNEPSLCLNMTSVVTPLPAQLVQGDEQVPVFIAPIPHALPTSTD